MDTAFGPDGSGRVVSDFAPGQDVIRAMTLQDDGQGGYKILVAGDSGAAGSRVMAVARYTPAGVLDPSFGYDGKVPVDFGYPSGSDALCFSMALDGGGRIVLGGVVFGAPYAGGSDFALARLHADGAPDTSFGNGTGRKTIDFANTADFGWSLAADDAGSILLGGQAGGDSAKLTASGALDTTFGPSSDGRATADLGGNDFAYSVALRDDGGITLSGSTQGGVGGAGTAWGGNAFALARFTPSGLPDPTFGLNGKLVTDFAGGDASANASLTTQGGGLLAGGSAVNAGGGSDFALARYLPDNAVRVYAPASTPGELIATASSAHDADLSWAYASDSRFYRVLRSETGAQGSFTLLGTPTGGEGNARNDAGLNAHTTYYYQVQASNGVDWSLPSAPFPVTTLDTPPVALSDGTPSIPYLVTHDKPLDVDPDSLLANDGDADGDAVHLEPQSLQGQSARGGTLGLTSDGKLRYTPPPGYVGPDSFTYAVGDGYARSGPATVRLEVTNAAPEARSLIRDSLPSGAGADGVLPAGDDDDAEAGETLAFSLVGQAQGGTATVSSDGHYAFAPDATGRDGFFVYKVSDGLADGNLASVTIHYPGNDDPLYTSPWERDVYTDQGQPIAGFVLAPGSAATVDGPADPAERPRNAADGRFSLDADGSYSYTPREGFVGTDWFTYRVSDGTRRSAYQTLFIHVRPISVALRIDETSTQRRYDDGALLRLDDGDWDADGTSDAAQTTLPAGDPNLTAMHLRIGPWPLPGGTHVTLSYARNGQGDVRVWQATDPAAWANAAVPEYEQILGGGTTQKVWTVEGTTFDGTVPATVYIAGVSASGSPKDVLFTLAVAGPAAAPATQPATQPTSRPAAATAPATVGHDWWKEAADAVDRQDWQKATDAMRDATLGSSGEGLGPTDGKSNQIDPAKLHIYVTLLETISSREPV